MQFIGDKKIVDHIRSEFDAMSKTVKAFSEIYKELEASDLKIIICSENDLLNDPHNETKTLTEFRSYFSGDTICLFNTRYETLESLVHNCLHEIGHVIIQSTPWMLMLAQTINGDYFVKYGVSIDISKPFWTENALMESISKSDEHHDNIPEEKICDLFAESLVHKNYNRQWWRQYIEEVDKAKKVGVYDQSTFDSGDVWG